jgi:hypothetical protein
MITGRDWFLRLGWTEGWAVVGAIVVGLVAATLFVEIFRVLGRAVVSKAAPLKKNWRVAFDERRLFRSAAWVLVVIVTDS